MKFMHIADVHLGADPDAGMFADVDRGVEIRDTFEKIIMRARKEQGDLLLVAGDLFHRQPLVRELREVDYLFREVFGRPVVLIAGNHDYIKAASNYRTFKWSDNVHLLMGDDTTGRLDRIYLENLNTEVYGFSYTAKEITAPLYRNARPEKNGRIHILLAHGGDAKHIPVTPSDLAATGFDYIALGHIHKPGIVVPGLAAYAGAPEPADHNDLGRHGVIIGEIRQGQDCRIAFLPMAKREYRHEELVLTEEDTNGSISHRIREHMAELGDADLYKWTLTGFHHAEMLPDTARLLQEPHVFEVLDRTRPAWEIAKLQAEHREDMIGIFIESFLKAGDEAEGGTEAGTENTGNGLSRLEEEALYAGLEAMLT